MVYSPLPLYHSVAGMIALAGTMKHGITMVMREKFSASNYWSDCVRYRVTVSPSISIGPSKRPHILTCSIFTPI